jgi:hypothetical protein
MWNEKLFQGLLVIIQTSISDPVVSTFPFAYDSFINPLSTSPDLPVAG